MKAGAKNGPALFIRVISMRLRWGELMTKEELIKKIRALLKMDDDLDFLLKLQEEELERLVASIRDRVYRAESP